MPNTATVTGVVGPGITATAAVINNVDRFTFKTGLLTVWSNDSPNVKEFDLGTAKTVTLTYSASVLTLTVA